jgi:hypothetical protein
VPCLNAHEHQHLWLTECCQSTPITCPAS